MNPFDITKASDFSDYQINDFWIEYPGVNELVSPKSPMSRYILGGKGSGKTHILRYFSIQTRKLTYNKLKKSLLKGIIDDEFVGFYLNCDSLTSNRFSDKNLTEEKWSIIFMIYIELWIGRAITHLASLLKESLDINEIQEETIVSKIFELLDLESENIGDKTVGHVIAYFSSMQKKLDQYVMRIVFEPDLKLETDLLKFTNGKLIFSIPKILRDSIVGLKKINFVLILDEFENFNENQQIYINTLIREGSKSVSFRIGGRLYGIKTRSTLIESEENKIGSEFDLKIIDEIARSNLKEYNKFIKDVFVRRIQQTRIMGNYDLDNINEIFDTSTYEGDLKSFIKKEKTYLKKLEKNLTKLYKNFTSNGYAVFEVIENIKNDNFVMERTGVSLIYQDIKNKRNIFETSKELNVEYSNSPILKENTRLYKKIKRSKRDTLAKLFKEFNSFQRYSGLQTFIDMSEGLPRNFLIILKNIYSNAIFNSEKPFLEKNKISEESQWKGVMQSSEWFFEDARDPRPDGYKIRQLISNIGEIFKLYRFSDFSGIDSCKSFSLSNDVSKEHLGIIESAVTWSLLLKSPLTIKSKNRNSSKYKYEMNGLISPLWDLPVQSGGTLKFDNEDISIILSPNTEDFKKYLKKIENDINFPFGRNLRQTTSDDSELRLF